MSRTTIDGLTVRTPSQAERIGAAMGTRRVVGGHLMDDVAPVKRSNTQVSTKREQDDLSLSGMMEDGRDDSDWSDLLAQLDNSPSSKKQVAKTKEDLITEEEESKPRRQKKPKTKKKSRVVRRVLLVLLALILVGGVALFIWGDGLISRLTNGNSGLIGTIWSLVSDEVPFETDANGRTNVLVFGTEGYNMDGATDHDNREGSGAHDGAPLTDSIMIISFDQETKDVALLSLPRDLKVPSACSIGKVNEVFWCNNRDGTNDEAGAQALMVQLSQVLGIDFQYWAHVNWGSLADIVDAVGGITVTLDEDVNDYNYTTMVIKAGEPTRLSGIQAVALARARHGTNGGDFTRGTSQQKIVEGIVQELVSGDFDLPKVLNLVNILGDNLRSNFSSDNIKAGAHLVSGFDMSKIRNVPLIDYLNWQFRYVTTATINGYSYVVPAGADGTATPNNYSRIHEYVAKMFSSNPAVREGAEIAVFNATEESGVAGTEKAALETDGYTVYGIGDAAVEDCAEKYCLYALTDEASGTRQALEERYGVIARSASELPGDVAAGYADFVVIIGRTE